MPDGWIETRTELHPQTKLWVRPIGTGLLERLYPRWRWPFLALVLMDRSEVGHVGDWVGRGEAHHRRGVERVESGG